MKKALIALLLIATPALADKVDPATKARADSLFEKAQAHYQAGEYQAAIELFKSAYQLVHDPVYLFNIAQSYRKTADCVEAFDYYSQYLEASKDAPNRDKVQGWLRELQPCADKTKAEHEAAVKAAEEDRRREAEAAKQAAQQAPKSATVDRGATLRLAGLATGGAGIVGLAVGVAFAIHGQSLRDQLAKDCPNGMCVWDPPGVSDSPKSLDDAGHRANTIAAIGLISGGVLALAGAGLYYYGHTQVETVVAPQPGGAVVGATVHF